MARRLLRGLMAAIAAAVAVAVAPASAQPAHDGAVSVSGYGVTLRPAPPYELGRAGDAGIVPDALVLSRQLDDGLQNALINPGRKSGRGKLTRRRQGRTWVHTQGKDGLSIALGVGLKELTGVIDARPGPPRRSWTIEAGPYRIAWPTGFTLASVGTRARWPFELNLVGEPDDAMIFLRGPMATDRAPSGARLVGPDQIQAAAGTLGGATWVELTYTLDDVPWLQRHYVVPFGDDTVVLVTCQAPARRSNDLVPACASVASSLAAR